MTYNKIGGTTAAQFIKELNFYSSKHIPNATWTLGFTVFQQQNC